MLDLPARSSLKPPPKPPQTLAPPSLTSTYLTPTQIPQLVTNYRNASASALSLPFLLIWFLGDICNLIGAAWAGLVPTVVAIAVYFCCLDGVLVLQWGYYTWVYGARGYAATATATANGKGSGGGGGGVGYAVEGEEREEQPLLARQRSRSRSGSITIPGSGSGSQPPSRRTSSSATTVSSGAARRRSSQASHLLLLAQILEEDNNQQGRPPMQPWMQNLLSILGVVVVGTLGWAIAWGSGAWTPTPVDSASGSGDGAAAAGPLGAQILGYASAVAYLGARIPQIVKNARERSCEGMTD